MTETIEDINTIPAELRERRQWVLWKYVDGRKTPFQPNGQTAKSNDPATWSDFDTVVGAGGYEGIGFVLSNDDPYVGVDLDSCRDAETGELAPWAEAIVTKLASYCEISPSGTGVKLTLRGAKPEGSRCVYYVEDATPTDPTKKPQVEIYERGRFWAFTGEIYRFSKIASRSAELAKVIQSVTPEPSKPRTNASPVVNDDALLEAARRYVDGAENSSQGGRNRAAFSLAGHLGAFVTESGRRLSGSQIMELMTHWNGRNGPPLDEVELLTTIRSALNSGTPREDKVVDEKRSPQAPLTRNDDSRVFLSLSEGEVASTVVERLGALGRGPKINEPIQVYQRGGVLVHAVESEDRATEGQLSIRQLPSALLRERISQSCTLVVAKKDGPERVRPPKWLVDAIHCRGWYGGHILPLAGVVQSPTLRADGSILQRPGYDEATGLLYKPNADYPAIPEHPTREDAQRAVSELLEVVADCEFADTEADSSAWIAMVLTQLGRQAITGCCPMFAVTATTRGSGKGLIADAASTISYGRPTPKRTFTPEPDELKKEILAIALEGVQSVLWDNVSCQLRGDSLDNVLTATSVSGRILGKSENAKELPMRAVFCVTGNNLRLGSDVARRVLPIRLAPNCEKPEERTGFKHPDLLAWVRENRPKLAVAGLTILRAYFAAGKPPQTGGTWGSFEAWSAVVRGAIVWAGCTDPMVTRETADEDDDSMAVVRGLIGGLLEVDEHGDGLTAREIVKELAADAKGERFPALREVVSEVATRKGNIDAKLLSYALRKYRGRIANGFKVDGQKSRGGVVKWAAVQVKRQRSGEDAGDGEDTFLPFAYAKKESAYRNGPETSQPSPASSPNQYDPGVAF